MKVEVTVTLTFEMDEARVLAQPAFAPPPPDTPEDEKRKWLREFWELCGFDSDRDHVDGTYVWLVDEDDDADFWWPRESNSHPVTRP